MLNDYLKCFKIFFISFRISFSSSLFIHQLEEFSMVVKPECHLQCAINISQAHKTALILTTQYKNSSGDEIANVNFYAVRPGATRIR